MVKKTIEIDINSDEAIKSIDNLRKQLDALRADIELDANTDKVKNSIKEINTLIEALDPSLILDANPNVAITQIEKIKTELDSLEGEIKVDGDDATKEIKKLRKQVQDLNDEVVNSNKKTTEGIKGVETATKGATKQIKNLGAFIGKLGLGLLIASFDKVKEIFKSSQPVVDLLNTSFEFLGLAFKDFVDFVSSNWSSATKPISEFFSSKTGQSIQRIGKLIGVELITRTKNLIQGIGGLGKALVKVFKGDFAGAADAAKDAFDNFGDALVGNAEESIKVEKSIENITKKVANYVKETVNAAKANIQLNKSAAEARIIRQGLIEQYDREAEKLRQIRDEERNTITERIEANNKLSEVLAKQEEQMLKTVDAEIAAAQAAFDRSGLEEDRLALIEAQQEKTAVLAQIEGFRSEQLSNDMALMREQMELRRSMAEADEERVMSEKEFNAELIRNEVLRLEKLKEVYQEENDVKEQRLLDDLARTKIGTQEQIDAQNAYFDFLEERRQQEISNEIELEQAKREQRQQTLDNLITIAGAESKIGKALFLAKQAIALQEIISEARKTITFSQLAAARSTTAVAEGTAQTAKIGFPQNIPMLIGYAAQAAGIIGAIKAASNKSNNIASSFGAGGATTSFATPEVPTTTHEPTPPQFNTVGTSGVNQLAETIQQQEQKPIKTYVVAGEVSTAQSLERNAVKEASL